MSAIESPADPSPVAYRARWVFPVIAPPIRDGVVTLQSGTIISVASDARPHSNARLVDLGETALIPGLINAHTHLEFSDCSAPIAPGLPFTDWIRAIRGVRVADPREAIRRGLAECAAGGTACVGEIATAGWDDGGAAFEREFVPPRDDMPAALPRGVVFRELLAPTAARIEAQLAAAQAHVEQFASRGRSGGGRFRAGLSPHAPYSVHPELFEQAIDLVTTCRLPVAMHLAETEEELTFLAEGTGPLAEMLREFGLSAEALQELRPGRVQPMDYLRALSRCERALVVHGNYLSKSEIEFVAAHEGLTVVYSPRTHAFFGHSEHPWRELLARGGRVALGTDSRASNPDLSLWNELLFLRERYPDVDPQELLALGTIRGALALGEKSSGAIAPGYRGDLAAVSLADDADPWEALFHPQSRMVGLQTLP